jgi:cysteine desulfurase
LFSLVAVRLSLIAPVFVIIKFLVGQVFGDVCHVTSSYFDCNATTPVEPAVLTAMIESLGTDFGNAGSRSHDWGLRAQRGVEEARREVAAVIEARPEEVIFTSGATESDNLAILGLVAFGEEKGKKHIISTAVEHKAVLEPLAVLEERGFDVTLISPNASGAIDAQQVVDVLREDTLLVSVMHVNNETGVCQPVEEIAEALAGHAAFFHCDAAQGFGKDLVPLQNPRLDLISASGHKIYGPKGIGALIARRRRFRSPPLQPLMYGGGQERGLRPGTLPVPLIVGMGMASKLARQEHASRAGKCVQLRQQLAQALAPFEPQVNGDVQLTMPHVLNVSLPGIDSEAAMLALKGVVAISNGSACTSQSYEPSHVLTAMGLSEERINGSLRFSWCHMTEEPDWDEVVSRLKSLL